MPSSVSNPYLGAPSTPQDGGHIRKSSNGPKPSKPLPTPPILRNQKTDPYVINPNNSIVDIQVPYQIVNNGNNEGNTQEGKTNMVEVQPRGPPPRPRSQTPMFNNQNPETVPNNTSNTSLSNNANIKNETKKETTGTIDNNSNISMNNSDASPPISNPNNPSITFNNQTVSQNQGSIIYPRRGSDVSDVEGKGSRLPVDDNLGIREMKAGKNISYRATLDQPQSNIQIISPNIIINNNTNISKVDSKEIKNNIDNDNTGNNGSASPNISPAQPSPIPSPRSSAVKQGTF